MFKRGSSMAEEAVFPAPGPSSVIEREPVQPSEQDLAVARLAQENDMLRGEIADLRAHWAEELAAAERRAQETAAREHVRDDAKRCEALVGTLTAARQQFETKLVSAAERAANDLAVLAMGKLFALRMEDADLLARVVAQRLADLDEQAVVELQLAPADLDGEVGAAVTAMLPEGTRVASDPGLRAGTARIGLRLGAAVIDPATGFERLRALLAVRDDDV